MSKFKQGDIVRILDKIEDLVGEVPGIQTGVVQELITDQKILYNSPIFRLTRDEMYWVHVDGVPDRKDTLGWIFPHRCLRKIGDDYTPASKENIIWDPIDGLKEPEYTKIFDKALKDLQGLKLEHNLSAKDFFIRGQAIVDQHRKDQDKLGRIG